MGMLSMCKNTKNKMMTYLIGGGLHHTLFNLRNGRRRVGIGDVGGHVGNIEHGCRNTLRLLRHDPQRLVTTGGEHPHTRRVIDRP